MLGGHGFEVLFLVHHSSRNVATASKYCKKFEVVKSINDGLAYLFENYKDKENKAVLLFTADKFSEAANQNLSQLNDYFYVAGPSQENVLTTIDDKYEMGRLADECGIHVPETWLIPASSVNEVNIFPAIIKPCSPAQKDFKTKVVSNKKQLLRAAKTFDVNRRYVIQPFIRKEADGLIYGCRTWDGITHLAGICVRNRWSDDGCGSFGYITSDIPNSVSLSGINLFLETIDFRGLFSVEYALTKDDTFFYEFNLRNDGTSVLFYNAGSNLALSFVNSCFGIKDEVPIKVKGKQYLMHEILDKFNIYDGNVSVKQWYEDKKKVTIHFLYDPDDMRPYEIQKSMETRTFIHHIISRSWINKIRLKIKNKNRLRNEKTNH